MRYLIISVCCLLLLSGFVPAARAHASLDHSSPAVGSKIKAAPPCVNLWFNAKLEANSSSVDVLDSANRQVNKKLSHLAPDNQSQLCVDLPPLSPGKYKVVWRVQSLDGHVTKGSFTFEIR